MLMKKWFFPILIILALLLAACGEASNRNTLPTPPVDTDPVFVDPVPQDEIPDTGEAQPADGADSAPVDAEPGSGLIGIPETGSGEVAGLSEMFGFQVVDSAGERVGVVRDYLINMCETYILYLVVDPDETNRAAEGQQQMLIPYEAVLPSVNDGQVDMQQGLYMLNASIVELQPVPVYEINTLDLENPQWDEELQAFWSQNFGLTVDAGCSVPLNTATNDDDQQEGESAQDAAERQTIYRLALASRLLGAVVVDGFGEQIGHLRDAAVLPESGRTEYFVIERAAGGLVALPPGAVNVRYQPDAVQPELILLVENPVFENAPAFDSSSIMPDASWVSYWDQYIPMTRDQLP
jgi:sporulation protein YlmC with PRC-barrel domain